MILINLLPEHYRQKKRAPFKFLAATAGVVAVNGLLYAWWVWTAFGVAAEVRSEVVILEDTKAGLEPQVAFHKELEKESKLFETREDALKKVTDARISWTQQVDQLVDLVNVGGDDDKYLIWLDDLSADSKENQRAGTFGKLKGSAHSGSPNFANVANFLEDVERSPLTALFFKPYPPSGTVQAKDEELIPAEITNFSLEMDVKAPKDRKRQ
jgi:Tfp pilus assembly protein PilN